MLGGRELLCERALQGLLLLCQGVELGAARPMKSGASPVERGSFV